MKRRSGTTHPDRACAELATTQHGLVNLAQARALGMPTRTIHRRVSQGRWERVLPRVFRIAGAPDSWRQRLVASCLWLPGAAVSHGAAAAWWELEGFPEGTVAISTVVDAKASASWLTVHRPSRLDSVDVLGAGCLFVTTPTRTLVDLCSVSSLEDVESALDDALRRGLTTLPRLRWAGCRLAGKGRSGSSVLRELLETRPGGYVPAESPLEGRLRRLLSKSGLPAPTGQYQVRDGGRLIARVDLAYPSARLAIEADGYRYHTGRAAWQRDLARRNALSLLGWTVLHVTWEDIQTRPGEVVERVRSTLFAPSVGNEGHLVSLSSRGKSKRTRDGRARRESG